MPNIPCRPVADIVSDALAFCSEVAEDLGTAPVELSRVRVDVEKRLSTGNEDEALISAAEAMSKVLHSAAEELTDTGAHLLKRQSRVAMAVTKEMCAKFRESGDKQLQAMSLAMVADAAVAGKETNKAVQSAKVAVEHFGKLQDRRGEASAMGALINAHVLKGCAGVDEKFLNGRNKDEVVKQSKANREEQFRKATAVAKEVVEIYRSLEDKKAEASALIKVTTVLTLADEPDDAADFAREARLLGEDLQDIRMQAQGLHALISADLHPEGEVDFAVEYAKELVKLLQDSPKGISERDTATAFHWLAKAHCAKKDKRDALSAINDAIEIFSRLENKTTGEGPALSTLVNVHAMREEYDEAAEAAQQAIDLFKKEGNKRREAKMLLLKAVTMWEGVYIELAKETRVFLDEDQKKLKEASKTAEAAMELFKEVRDSEGEAQCAKVIEEAVKRGRDIDSKRLPPAKKIFYIDAVTKKLIEEKSLHYWDVDEEGPQGALTNV